MGSMTRPGGSVSFDRAADFYDRTRVLAPDAEAAQTALLVDALAGVAGPVLEVGVGTGRVAVPLAAAGLPMVGVDLAPAMLARLRAKDGTLPVVCGDAMRLPVRDGAVGAAVVAHVLHLVADWRAALAELRRVLRPGGVLLATRGAQPDGVFAEAQAVARQAAGWTMPEGRLDDLSGLDDELGRQGAEAELLPAVVTGKSRTAEDLLTAMADNLYSWTWEVTDARRADATAAARAYVESTYGDPASLVLEDRPILWRRYRLP
jgi:SAM-dependent methyltransferase